VTFKPAHEALLHSLQRGDKGPGATANTKGAGQLKKAESRRNRLDVHGAVGELSCPLEDGEVFYAGKDAVFDSDADLIVMAWQSPTAPARSGSPQSQEMRRFVASGVER